MSKNIDKKTRIETEDAVLTWQSTVAIQLLFSEEGRSVCNDVFETAD